MEALDIDYTLIPHYLQLTLEEHQLSIPEAINLSMAKHELTLKSVISITDFYLGIELSNEVRIKCYHAYLNNAIITHFKESLIPDYILLKFNRSE
jgi:hypothetical protein